MGATQTRSQPQETSFAAAKVWHLFRCNQEWWCGLNFAVNLMELLIPLHSLMQLNSIGLYFYYYYYFFMASLE